MLLHNIIKKNIWNTEDGLILNLLFLYLNYNISKDKCDLAKKGMHITQ